MSDEIINQSPVKFDEEKLQRFLPFRLQKTAMAGVFTIPPPPPGFDPRTARPSELIQAGFPWKRPNAESNPVGRALWDRVMAREWRRAEAVPVVRPRRRPRPFGPMSDGPNVNSNWAGAVLPTGQLDGIVGQWQVPQISQPAEPAVYDNGFEGWEMSSWIGIGGYGPNLSNNLLQCGVNQELVANGGGFGCSAFYQWWVEGDESTYQSVQFGPDYYVNPGDSVFCSVQYVLDDKSNPVGGYVWVGNETSGVYVPGIVLPAPSNAVFSGGSAEWIVEAPNGGEWGPGLNGGQSSLPAFTPVAFAGVACGPEGIFGPWTDAVGSTVQEVTTAPQGGMPLTSTSINAGGVTVTFVG
jgi:hypothetical protein